MCSLPKRHRIDAARAGPSAQPSPMDNDSDIVRAAELMISKYGDIAPLRATERADWLAAVGQAGASALWRRIARMIEELLAARRSREDRE